MFDNIFFFFRGLQKDADSIIHAAQCARTNAAVVAKLLRSPPRISLAPTGRPVWPQVPRFRFFFFCYIFIIPLAGRRSHRHGDRYNNARIARENRRDDRASCRPRGTVPSCRGNNIINLFWPARAAPVCAVRRRRRTVRNKSLRYRRRRRRMRSVSAASVGFSATDRPQSHFDRIIILYLCAQIRL